MQPIKPDGPTKAQRHRADNRLAHQRDFSVNARLPRIAALAAVIGGIGTAAAFVLSSLIHVFTNLFFFGTLSFVDRSPARHAWGAWVVLVPVAGGLIVGLMARFGSEKIRGHGIPEAIEAIEAILFGKSRMSPKDCRAQAAVVGRGDWQRRPVRRGR